MGLYSKGLLCGAAEGLDDQAGGHVVDPGVDLDRVIGQEGGSHRGMTLDHLDAVVHVVVDKRTPGLLFINVVGAKLLLVGWGLALGGEGIPS